MSEKSLGSISARNDYGDFVYVRSLIIRSPSPGRISLAMEDVAHAFQMEFAHEGGKVTSVKAAWNFEPLSSCNGATQALEALVGCQLGDNLFAIARQTDAKQQCTHMYDMFCLAATHAHELRPDYRYDVVVPDAVNGPVIATLIRNGEEQLVMELAREDYQTIVRPEPCRGMNILKGFMSWVRSNVPADQHEHYFIMQKALFVARGQTVNLASTVGKSAKLSGPPDGSCYGSQPERYQAAVRINAPRSWRQEAVGRVMESFKLR